VCKKKIETLLITLASISLSSNGLQLPEGRAFATKLDLEKLKHSLTTKLSLEHETLPFG
jgi:hypothetical protein